MIFTISFKHVIYKYNQKTREEIMSNNKLKHPRGFKMEIQYKNELIAQSQDLIKIWSVAKEGRVLFAIATVHDTLAYYDEAQADTEKILSDNHEMLRDYVLKNKDSVKKCIEKFCEEPCKDYLFELNELFMVLERIDEEILFDRHITKLEKTILNNPDKFKHLDSHAIKMKTNYRMFDDTVLCALTTIA